MAAYVLKLTKILEFNNYPNPQDVGQDHYASGDNDFVCDAHNEIAD
ncbi:hypothetical protein [Dyadobacter sp. CY326]|nr:hypothetical protein [Dyadobacter sp. CY326]MCE7068529.1 hypothetical protein [Dyadobacter sp. CY326]